MPDKPIRHLVTHLQFLANQHGTYIPVQKVADTVGQASLELFNALLFPKNPVKAGRTFGPGYNRAVDSRLAPFLRRQEYSADTDVQATSGALPMRDGQFALPAECAYVSYYDAPGADTVEEVEGHALRLRRACPITGPTTTFPLVTTVENGDKQFYPASTPRCGVQYYATPPKPVFALSDPENDASYADADSVDTGWKEDAHPELISRTLTLLGIPLRDGALQQAGITHTTQDV